MRTHEERLKDYIQNLPKRVGNHNAPLLTEFTKKYYSLNSEPSASRILTVLVRMCSVSKMLGNKPLDELTEDDLQALNKAMRDKQMASASFYRKSLKKFLKMKDRKKYIDLLESDYFVEPARKANAKKLVDPEKFWSQQEIESYMRVSKEHSPKQAAFGALWLSTGLRPHELFGLRKKDIVFEEPTTLLVKVGENTKTGSRTVVLQNGEAKSVWDYSKPYLDSIEDEITILFPDSMSGHRKRHFAVCEDAKIGKDKQINFYVARKMALTRFYNSFGMVKAAQLSGHIPGSDVMRHYVGLTENQLKDQTLARVESKMCPNPNCSFLNEAHIMQCVKCGAPLSKEQYGKIIQDNVNQLIETRLESFKKDILISLMNAKGT